MPLKNIELRHGGRYDSFIWRIEIPSNKKVLYDVDNYILSFIFDGYNVRHFVGRKKADALFKKNYSADDLF